MKQMVPEYLLNFIEEVYPYEKPKFYGQCLITPVALNKLKTLYNLYSSVKPVNYGERMCPNYIVKMLEEQIFTELTIEDTGYTLETPSKSLKTAQLNIVGGMSYKSENLCSKAENLNSNWDYFMTFYAKPNTTYFVKVFNINSTVSDSSVTLCSTTNQNAIETYYSGSYTHYLGNGFTFTTGNITAGLYRLRFIKNNSVNTTGNTMIGLGSTIPTTFKPYFEGIRDSSVTSIAADSTLTIPDEVQALEGYGQSNPDDSTEYNYIDFNQKKFIQIGYIDENDEWQELDTPVETDISEYIDNNFIEVVPNGTVTFNNEYDQAVPYSIDFVVEV